ncbi:hydroxyacylglutathione hydrolase, partial [Endobacter medicaginis]|nr:hydroxyacylglutathione hydrolase [Endobacter medicaginis]
AVAPAGEGFTIALDDGSDLVADRLVLAVAHPPPATPPFLRAVPPAALVADPWADGAVGGIGAASHVLIVGTGLTASDVIASLASRGHRGTITALSRHGLLPRPRTEQAVEAYGDFATAPATTALALLRRIRATIAELRVLGRPWEDAIDALRRDAPILWRALPKNEKRRLLRHARAFWDTHRFQAAPQIDATVRRLRAAGQLHILTGRLRSVEPVAAGLRATLRATWTPRGGSAQTLDIDHVVNCTGPGHGLVVATSPVLASLAAAGLVREDGLGLGLDVTADNRAIGAEGRPHPYLFVAGPLARSAHGELMGLPQVAAQPRDIARAVARQFAVATS